MCPDQDQTHNPGCALTGNWSSNILLYDAQPTERHQSGCTPCVLNIELEGAETHGAGGEPEAGRKHTLCVLARGHGPADNEGVQTPQRSLHEILTRFIWDGCPASLWSSEASYAKYLLSLEDSLEPPVGQEERMPLLQVHPCSPTWMKFQTSETGQFFPGPFSPPFIFCAPMWVGALKVFDSSKFYNKLYALEGHTGYSVFYPKTLIQKNTSIPC